MVDPRALAVHVKAVAPSGAAPLQMRPHAAGLVVHLAAFQRTKRETDVNLRAQRLDELSARAQDAWR